MLKIFWEPILFIYMLQVLHGGAAYKDGRLQINDQLIGIEEIDLRCMKKNAEASNAITRCLKAIGRHFKLMCKFIRYRYWSY